MRLFLASEDSGILSGKLEELMGDNRKILVITNAKDHYDEAKQVYAQNFINFLNERDFKAEELDLRPYFGREAELREYINQAQPGCIFSQGGNAYTLATALKLSGMGNIIRDDLANDKYVYGGLSAGSIVAGKDLAAYDEGYDDDPDDQIDRAKETYGEATTDGLGLIEEYVCPHADTPEYGAGAKHAAEVLTQHGLAPIVLNDTDVFIVSGQNRQVFRGE